MPLEIERRFLVETDIAHVLEGVLDNDHIEQRYIVDTGGWVMRVRKVFAFNDHCRFYMTMKRPAGGFANHEIEFEITQRVYDEMLAHAGPAVMKRRTRIQQGDVVLEIDTFEHPKFGGLQIMEVELPDADHPFDVPDWCGREITGERTYSNVSLAQALRDPPAGPYADAYGLIPPPAPPRPLHMVQVVSKI
jgi:CYTH domain-containing protein